MIYNDIINLKSYLIRLMNIKKKYLTSSEYNKIVVTIQKSVNYITDKEKKEFDLIFDKLFVITEDDIISNEEINHPISDKESWDIAIKKANSL